MPRKTMSEDAKSKPSRLGRGLSSLIGEVEAVEPSGGEPGQTGGQTGRATSEIPLADIAANPAQPRQQFDESALEELSESIRVKGVLQPILLRPDPKKSGKFQIIAGERRWRAAKRAGLKTIPALVRDSDELELLEIGIIENVQRSDLNPMEEAEAYSALMKRFGRTQESLAESVGKSRAHIANTLRLLKLPDSVRDLLRENKLSAGHARTALTVPDPAGFAERIVEKNLSVREAEAMARRLREAGDGGAADTTKPRGDETKDVDTKALEADLGRTLGLSVDIRHRASGGELRIRYRELEQLDDLCRRLTAQRDK